MRASFMCGWPGLLLAWRGGAAVVRHDRVLVREVKRGFSPERRARALRTNSNFIYTASTNIFLYRQYINIRSHDAARRGGVTRFKKAKKKHTNIELVESSICAVRGWLAKYFYCSYRGERLGSDQKHFEHAYKMQHDGVGDMRILLYKFILFF